jgi:hypothetical protein
MPGRNNKKHQREAARKPRPPEPARVMKPRRPPRRKPPEPATEERVIMRDVSARLPHHHVVDIDPEDATQQLDDTGAR